MIIHHCDKCSIASTQKRGEQAQLPTGWKPIRFQAGYTGASRQFELCPACGKSLGLDGDWKADTISLGDSLIEVITEIVDERIEP